jgi:hypothetical protein
MSSNKKKLKVIIGAHAQLSITQHTQPHPAEALNSQLVGRDMPNNLLGLGLGVHPDLTCLDSETHLDSFFYL